MSGNYHVFVLSDLVMNGGTLNLNASTMTGPGELECPVGTFNAGTSTVSFLEPRAADGFVVRHFKPSRNIVFRQPDSNGLYLRSPSSAQRLTVDAEIFSRRRRCIRRRFNSRFHIHDQRDLGDHVT